MQSHSVLGVSRNAGIPEIKKAYARLLKLNRPDDNPEGFQALQQAYEACLMLARDRKPNPAIPQDEFFDSTIQIGERDIDAQPGDPPVPAEPFRPAPSRPAPPIAATVDLPRLMQEIVRAAERHGLIDLQHWLNANEDLYSLDVKRRVADSICDYLSRDLSRLTSSSFEILYEFFDLNPIANPHLRSGYQFLNLWQQVRDDEKFDEHVARSRKSCTNYFDKLSFQELFGPPNRFRRLSILLWPRQASRLRSLMEGLLNMNEASARRAFAPGALDHWSHLMDRGRLDWRRVLAMLAATLIVLVPTNGIIATFAGAQLPIAEAITFWATITFTWTAIATAIWLVFSIGQLIKHRYRQWRAKKFGTAEPQAGESIFGDAISVSTLISALLALLCCGLAAIGAMSESTLAMTTLATLGMAWFVLLLGSGRVRWDALIFAAPMSKFMMSIGIQGSATLAAKPGLAFAIAASLCALMLVGLDWFYAWCRKLSLPASRREYNWLATGMGFAIGFVLVVSS